VLVIGETWGLVRGNCAEMRRMRGLSWGICESERGVRCNCAENSGTWVATARL
jgi:hypothetical protein